MRSNGLDNACALMAEHDRMRDREYLVAGDHVGVAHARGNDSDDHLIFARQRQRYRLQFKRAALLADHGGLKIIE